MDNGQLQALVKQGVVVIDVRREDEWSSTGIIEGAHLLTFFDRRGRYDVKKWLSSLKGIVEKDQPVVLVCAAGVRSRQIADFLDKKAGYLQVHNITKGMSSWLAQGLAVVPYKKGAP